MFSLKMWNSCCCDRCKCKTTLCNLLPREEFHLTTKEVNERKSESFFFWLWLHNNILPSRELSCCCCWWWRAFKYIFVPCLYVASLYTRVSMCWSKKPETAIEQHKIQVSLSSTTLKRDRNPEFGNYFEYFSFSWEFQINISRSHIGLQ